MAAGLTIRALRTIDDCRDVVALEREVWEYTDAEDVVPAALLAVSAMRGGILLGAFDAAGQMTGFVWSMPAVKQGHPTQWSHMLGVAGAARGRGVGRLLKLAQRERALEMGLDLIEWTFDPLQAANAHLNFNRLGVVVQDYEENIYGESSSALHRGSPTDRFVAEWRLDTPHVRRRILAASGPLVRDAHVAAAPVVNPSRPGRWLAPGVASVTHSERRLLVEIPTSFSAMQQEAPALALEWRLATRQIFQHYFSRGYRVVDFFLSTESGRGQYLLVKPEPEEPTNPEP